MQLQAMSWEDPVRITEKFIQKYNLTQDWKLKVLLLVKAKIKQI